MMSFHSYPVNLTERLALALTVFVWLGALIESTRRPGAGVRPFALLAGFAGLLWAWKEFAVTYVGSQAHGRDPCYAIAAAGFWFLCSLPVLAADRREPGAGRRWLVALLTGAAGGVVCALIDSDRGFLGTDVWVLGWAVLAWVVALVFVIIRKVRSRRQTAIASAESEDE